VKSTIYKSESIRPAHLQGSTMDPEFVQRLSQMHLVGMEPLEVGEKVLRAIRNEDFYILTHPEFRQDLTEICEEVLAALPDEPVPPERLAIEERRREGVRASRESWKVGRKR